MHCYVVQGRLYPEQLRSSNSGTGGLIRGCAYPQAFSCPQRTPRCFPSDVLIVDIADAHVRQHSCGCLLSGASVLDFLSLTSRGRNRTTVYCAPISMG